MLLPPLGYGGDAREIEAFYARWPGATELPIMAYNNPKASGTDMGPGSSRGSPRSRGSRR